MTSQPPPVRAGVPEPAEATEMPHVGELAIDTSTGRIGRVMATGDTFGSRGMWWLRPINGGLEWDVDRDHVKAAPPDAQESA